MFAQLRDSVYRSRHLHDLETVQREDAGLRSTRDRTFGSRGRSKFPDHVPTSVDLGYCSTTNLEPSALQGTKVIAGVRHGLHFAVNLCLRIRS
jgi:hypothetical protein